MSSPARVFLLSIFIALPLAATARGQANPKMADATRLVEELAALPSLDAVQQAVADGPIAITPYFLRALNDRGNKLIEAHDFDGAESWLQLAFRYADAQQDAYYLAMALRNLSEVSRQTNNYDLALDRQMRSLEWARVKGDAFYTASGLLNLANIYRRLGNEDEGLAAARDGLAIAETVDSPALLANAHSSLAGHYSWVGDYRSALEHYNKALAINRASGNRVNETIALCNIAGIYHSQGELALAIETLQRCTAMAARDNLTITQARFLGELADTYFADGNTALARQSAERSLEMARALKHREIIAAALGSLADVSWTEGRQADAIASLEESVRMLDEVGNKDVLTSVLARLGRYQFEAGRIDAGLATLTRGRGVARASGDRLGLYAAATAAGSALRTLGRSADARAALDEAIRAVEGVRADVAGPIAQASFFADKGDAYAEMVALDAAENLVAPAFESSERGRTLALITALHGGRVSPLRIMTAAERREESRLRQQISAADIALAAASGTRIAALTARRDKARLEYMDFERTLYAAHPELPRARLEVPPATVADAAATLPDARTALLEFTVTRQATYLFVVRKNQPPRLLTLPISADRLTKAVTLLERKIATRALDYRAAAQQLHRMLIAPARAMIADATTLAIVPDGALWRLPFAALEDAGGAPLIERYTLFEVPSVTVLREFKTRQQTRRLKTMMAVGNPPGASLPAADAGLSALSSLYGPSRARLLTGAAASEAAFKASAGRYDVVQVLSHGVIDNTNPLYSYVSLAGGGGEDGRLEAREIADLDLRAQLVVLSACETARGGLSGGEGLMGMTWALFLAGSPATVATGWKVDEAATSALTIALHRSLRKGEPPAAALRHAALEVRSDAAYRHPFYWAAFVLSGDGF